MTEIWSKTPPSAKWVFWAFRRSLYIFVRRNTPYPLLDTFDWANPLLVHSRREVTTTAPQALAGRVAKEAGSSDAVCIERLYQILFSRSPDKFEKETLLSSLDSEEKLVKAQISAGKKVATPDGFGENPELKPQVDKLYKIVLGRNADRFDKAALVEYLNKQQQKQAKADAADGDGDGPGITVTAAEKEAPKGNVARAARPWVPGSSTAWAPPTRTCRASWSWPTARAPGAAAAAG
ncbi:MAG: DUF1553 domain-containing protein [Actinomycetota bacterium]